MKVSKLLAVLDCYDVNIYNADRTKKYERDAALNRKVIKVEPFVQEDWGFCDYEECHFCDTYVVVDVLTTD